MSTKRDYFHIIGQAYQGMVVDSDAVLILDTNVVSVIYSVVKRGFALADPQHVRAAHLLRWLASRPDVAVSALFGVIEGSGFHAGAIDPLVAAQRTFATMVFTKWGTANAEEWIASGKPAPLEQTMPDDAIHPDNAVEMGELLLPWTVLPGYVAALAASLLRREGVEGIEAAEALHELLVSRLGHVPAFGWGIGALMFVGTPKVRRDLEQELFKLTQPDIRKVCMSAGWDLGFMELMSVARTPQVSPMFKGRAPLLATDESRLGPAAMFLRCIGNSGTFHADDQLFDFRWRDQALATMRRLQAKRDRTLDRASMPTWDSCASAARSLESELGIADASALSLRGEHIVLVIPPRTIELWMSALLTENSGTAVVQLIDAPEPDSPLIPAGALVVSLLMQMLAKELPGELRDVAAGVLDSAPQEVLKLTYIQIAARLGIAIAEEDWSWTTLLLQSIERDRSPGLAAVCIHHLARMLLTAVAESRGLLPTEQAQEMLAQLRSGALGATEGDDRGDRPPPRGG